MSVTLSSIPSSFDEALGFLKGKDSRACGNNTTVLRVQTGIGVRYHNTIIGIFHADGTLTVSTGGWHTVTTKSRINRMLYDARWTLGSTRGQMHWTYRHGNRDSETVEFRDGDRVFLGRGKGCAIWQEYGK